MWFFVRCLGLKLGVVAITILMAAMPLFVSLFTQYMAPEPATWTEILSNSLDESLYLGIGATIGVTIECFEINWDRQRDNQPFPNVGNALTILALIATIICFFWLFAYYSEEESFEAGAQKSRIFVPWMLRTSGAAVLFAVLGQLAFTYRKAHRHLEQQRSKGLKP